MTFTAAEIAWLGFTPMEKRAVASFVQLWRRFDLPNKPDFEHWSVEYAREVWELVTESPKVGIDKDTLIQLLTTMDVWDPEPTKQQWVPKGWSAEPVQETQVQQQHTKTAIPRGEERWVKVGGNLIGTIWEAQSLYQFEGTIYRVADAVSLDVSVWDQIKHLDRLEMVKGDRLERWCTGEAARAEAKQWNTRNGPRIMLPLAIWSTP